MDNNLENKVIDICKVAGIDIEHMDIEGCHRLPLSRNNTVETKSVIVEHVNRKQTKNMLQLKKIVGSGSNAFVVLLLSLSLGQL